MGTPGTYGINFIPTKDFVLSRVSQEQIMSYYLGIQIELDTQFRSPLRSDSNPTCGFAYASNGKLMFRDFSGHFWGDCFDVVCHIKGCNFQQALNIVCNDLNIIKTVKTAANFQDSRKDRKVFAFRQRGFWSEVDKDYWLQYHIHSKTLRKFHVFPIYLGWIDGRIVYRHKESDPCYAYFVRTDENGVERIKFYMPLRKKGETRFMGNCDANDIFGYDVLPDTGDLLIITKSLKDVMVLHELGFVSIGVQAESMGFSKNVFDELSSRFKRIITLFDFDNAGVTLTNFFRKNYGSEYRFLTNGKFKTIDFGAKDIADFNKQNNPNTTLQLINSYL